jgi:hypothetical protein
MFRSCARLCTLLVSFAISIFPQTMGTGTITGTVTDATGAVVPSAKIIATNGGTGIARSVITNSSGTYVIPAAQIGTYKIVASHPGFKSIEQDDVHLDTDSAANVNFTLQVGPSDQSVTVTGAPPELQTSSSEMGTVATGAQVSELSFNGRNYSQILTLGTGIASQNTGHRMGVGQEGNPLMSVNGGRITNTKFTYDGIIAMDTGGNRGLDLFPPMDALAEVQIKTSNYTADSGSYGYGMVNVVTKSGGNQFHGDLYEINGVSAVDARNFFDNQRAPFVENIFGFTLGGPVYIPHHYNSDKSKTFFFLSEGWNRRQGPQLVNFTSPPASTFTAETVDALMRTGNFTGQTAAIKDPTTGQPFPGNIIPSSRIDPNATILFNRFYPLPNRTGNPNYVATPDSGTDWREDMFRLDQMFTQNVILTLRYAHDSWTQNQGIISPGSFSFPTGPGFFSKPGHNAIARLTWTLSPTTVNVFTFGFSRNSITQRPILADVSRTGLNIPELFPGNEYNAIPIVTLSGFGGIGVGGLTNNVNNVYESRDDLTHIAGNHTLKFGFDFLRIQKFSFAQTNTEGTFAFNGTYTGNPVADMLLGDAFTYTEASGAPNGYLFANTYEMYAQDDWKIRQNLTINLGLRWSIFATPPDGFDKYNNLSDFIPSLYNPANAPKVNADGSLVVGSGNLLNGMITPSNQQGLGLPSSLRNTRYVMPGPRIGFAWSPGNSTKTVIRAGYGIFYHWDNSNQESLRLNPPYSTSANISNTSLSNPGGGVNKLFPVNLNAFDPNYLYPNVQQWSIGVQRQLPGQFVFSASYVGNHAVHLDQEPNLNQPQPSLAVANGLVNVATVRPYLGYGNIVWDERNASANYNALQVSANRRFDNGFAFQFSYTYSKSIAFGFGQNPFVQPDEKALSNLDQTHNVTINYIYDLPFFRHSSGFAHALLGGWEWSGIATFQSGFPFTVTISGDRAGVGGGTQRPNVIGTPAILGTVSQFFNTGAFALPALGTFGNEGANTVRGPGIANDFTMNFFKNFGFRLFGKEGQKLRIGAEIFNIFNHANFSAVGAVFASATYGHITAALDPREIQFSARLTF